MINNHFIKKSNLELQVKWCGKGPVIDVTLMSVIYDQCQLSLTDISKNWLVGTLNCEFLLSVVVSTELQLYSA